MSNCERNANELSLAMVRQDIGVYVYMYLLCIIFI